MKPDEIDRLGQEFVTTVIAARDAYGADIPAHNRWFRRSDRAAQKLIERGENGKGTLEALFGHAEPIVRLAAASYVLKWAPARPIPVLEDLLIWAKRDLHFGISVLDVDARVFASRSIPLSSR